MRMVVQRVSKATLSIDDEEDRSIGVGFVVLVGFTHDDNQEDIAYGIRKLINLRVFPDADGKMNASIQDIEGQLLVVSQFTLYGSTKKGNRPSFMRSAKPPVSEPLYQTFVQQIKQQTQLVVKTGTFGAAMQIHLVNDGPVTLVIDSKQRDF